jgi:nucleotide-binding universal stress UspA family protein
MVRLSRVLCPVDFSDASRHAVKHAVAVARWSRASITALHVDGETLAARDAILSMFERAHPDGVDVNVAIESGRPSTRILDCAEEVSADLIVMGTHGASGFEHLVLGSVTEKVLHKAPCPVLTVPPHAQATSQLPYKHLLCATDLSDGSVRPLDLAQSFARDAPASLTLVHVIEWPWEEPPAPRFEELPAEQAAALAGFRRAREETATRRLADLALVGADHPGRVSYRVAHGKPYVEILRAACEIGADLIVMGIHGRSAADLAVFGSTTNQVVRRATCPVLTMCR